MTPDEYCQQKAVQSGSSFYYSFLFLPPERRRAITALYAYCREVDDAVDECDAPGAMPAAEGVAFWRAELARCFDGGTPQTPQGRQLQPLIRAMEDFKNDTLLQENDLDAAFSNSIRLAMRGNLFAALDGLFDILRQDKHFRKDRARTVSLSLLELVDPLGSQTLEYRKELTHILF